MAAIETVTGAIDASELGTTLIHEHLRTRDEAVHEQFPHVGTAMEDPPYAVAPGDDERVAIEAAKSAVALGIDSIADPSAMFLGRDIAFMRRVSEASGLQVVPCTGIYTYDHLPPFFVSRDADQIAEIFVHDIERGIQGTEIKAAFLKVAADEPGVTENVEKVHRAAARASLQTGRPIMAHSRPASETAPRQIELLLEEGVDPSKIQIAHCGDTDDLDYLERVLETGVYAGLDRYGIDMYLPFDRRQATATALLERGYAERLFLAADSCATLDWFPASAVEQLVGAGMVSGWNIRMVPEKVLPQLREAGLTEDQERAIMVENPVRWLTGE